MRKKVTADCGRPGPGGICEGLFLPEEIPRREFLFHMAIQGCLQYGGVFLSEGQRIAGRLKRRSATIAKRLNTIVSFTDSYASWQEGAIANSNKLIRQYIPKALALGNLMISLFSRSIQTEPQTKK